MPPPVDNNPIVTCQECQTKLGGKTGKDVYSHLLICLNVEPNALHRIKTSALAAGNENGKRIIHLVDALLGEE